MGAWFPTTRVPPPSISKRPGIGPALSFSLVGGLSLHCAQIGEMDSATPSSWGVGAKRARGRSDSQRRRHMADLVIREIRNSTIRRRWLQTQRDDDRPTE